MLRLFAYLNRQLSAEEGQDAAEYALLIGLIALAVVVAVTALGVDIAAVYNEIAAGIPPF